MPISDFLDGQRVDPESRRIIGVAWELARAALHVSDRPDASAAAIARKIVELAKAGERNPDILCERALEALARGEPPSIDLRPLAKVQRRRTVPASR